MANDEKLSIITICYNIKDEIERTCQSIVTQTCDDFEWVVIDGGSTDGTLDILNKYKNRIDIFVSEPDKGIYNAMNKGINLAHGKWLNFMNGGDEFAGDNVIDQFYHHVRLNTSDVIYGNALRVLEKKSQVSKYPSLLDKMFFFGKNLNHQSCFIKKELFSIYGLYNEDYSIISDWEKFLIFQINNCKFSYMDVLVAKFYAGGISSSHKLQDELEILRLKYYTNQEVISQKFISYTLRMFGVVPILRVKNKQDFSATRFLLFGFVPLYTIQRTRTVNTHSLFGFIPWLKLNGQR